MGVTLVVMVSYPGCDLGSTGSNPVGHPHDYFAILAQLVELLISNQNVIGSKPIYRSKHKSQGSRFLVSFAPLVDALSIIAP